MGRRFGLFLSFVFVFLSFSGEKLHAQDKDPILDSYTLIQTGMSLADSSQYDAACKLFEQVPRSDTNHLLAVYEDAITRITAGEDSIAIPFCREGIAMHSEYSPDFYKFLASAYIDQNKNKEAIALMRDTAIPAFPNVYLLHYTLGVAYYKAQQYDSAIASFQRAIGLNLFHSSSHYYLALCCLGQGRMIPAMLSLQFFLLLEPESSRSLSTVQLLEQVSKGKYDYDKTTKVDPAKYNDGVFNELELDIKSKVALSDQYPAKTKVAYDVMKQCQLFLEKLEYVPNSGNYWMDTYVPFFTDIQKKDYFEPYIYFIMGSVGSSSDALQKEITKDKRPIDVFAKWAGDYLTQKNGKVDVMVNGQKKTQTRLFYDNHILEGIGDESEKNKVIGDWVIYNRYTGTLAAKGMFNKNGDKDGLWTWYYFDGVMQERTQYKDGKRNGLSELWYKNGAPRAKYNFQDDKLSGEFWTYDASGNLQVHGNKINDKYIGKYTEYYSNGKVHDDYNYITTGPEGKQTSYYINGQIAATSIYANGKKTGFSADYYSNDTLQDSGEFKDDNIYGHWKYFYADGSLKNEGMYDKNGVKTGLWTSYYQNGKKFEESNYKDGKLDGADVVYDYDGIKYARFDAKNDEFQHVAFYDKSGKTIFETKTENGKLAMQDYYANGVMAYQGDIVYGKRKGLWKWYTSTGALSSEENYLDGKLNGLKTDYYTDGKVKDSVNYAIDQPLGVYREYYENGQLKSLGWYILGERQGDWYEYNQRGTMTSHVYYLNDSPYGYSDYYDINGRLSSEEYNCDLGYFDKAWLYDTMGNKVIYTYTSDKGNGTFTASFNNGQHKTEKTFLAGNTEGVEKTFFYDGKIQTECNYLQNNRDGKYTSYYDNGNIYSVYNYLSGELNGEGMLYFDNGKPREKENYLEGSLNGNFIRYYDNGHVRLQTQCVDGNIEGDAKFYFEDSTLYGTISYHNGIITGYSFPGKDGNLVPVIPIEKGTGNVTCYFSNGNKALECTYSNGSITGKRVQYTPAGKPFEDENYQSGSLMGPQKYYYASGGIKAEENYYWGNKDGICNYYYTNGKLKRQENWVMGTRQGTFKYYDEKGNLTKTVVYYNDVVVSEK